MKIPCYNYADDNVKEPIKQERPIFGVNLLLATCASMLSLRQCATVPKVGVWWQWDDELKTSTEFSLVLWDWEH